RVPDRGAARASRGKAPNQRRQFPHNQHDHRDRQDPEALRRPEAMIRNVHTMFYSSEPEKLRAFLRDKLGFPATDVGGGWLIFDLPEADMGCHPADPKQGAPSGTNDISFYCDDIEKTVA